MKTKIAGVVILYNPETKVENNLQSYLPLLDKLFLWDNSTEVTSWAEDLARNNNQLIYLHTGYNDGIAKPLNKVAAQCFEERYDWLLTMDQDSSFQESDWLKFNEILTTLSQQDIGTISAWHQFPGRKEAPPEQALIAVKSVFTSGSFVNLSAWNQVGGWSEELFIDEVDHDFCLKLLKNQWQVMVASHIKIQHALGSQRKVKSLMSGRNEVRLVHSPIRLYYMVRNAFWIRKTHGKQYSTLFPNWKSDLFNKIKNNLLFNGQFLATCYYLIRGIFDFIAGKKGRI